MNDSHSNDSISPSAHEPDAHGQAAMLLVESLIHGLVERSVITVRDAVEIVGVAVDVKQEIVEEVGDSSSTMDKSLAILSAVSASLEIDIVDLEKRPWPPIS